MVGVLFKPWGADTLQMGLFMGSFMPEACKEDEPTEGHFCQELFFSSNFSSMKLFFVLIVTTVFKLHNSLTVIFLAAPTVTLCVKLPLLRVDIRGFFVVLFSYIF